MPRALTPLQSSVPGEAAARGERFAPFEQGTLERYADTLRHIAPDGDLVSSAANVQQALVALQGKGLIWRAARGVYALEDTALADLMRWKGRSIEVPHGLRPAPTAPRPPTARRVSVCLPNPEPLFS